MCPVLLMGSHSVIPSTIPRITTLKNSMISICSPFRCLPENNDLSVHGKTPVKQDVYKRQGFMGSPQMNFLDAQIVEKGNNLIAKIGDNDVVIPAAKAKVLKESGYVGKTVVLGIRPEDIHDSQMFIEASPSAPMTSTVKVYELLGAEVFLYFDVNGTQVTARVDPRTTSKTGDAIKFAFDMEKSHFFDKETELVICN